VASGLDKALKMKSLIFWLLVLIPSLGFCQVNDEYPTHVDVKKESGEVIKVKVVQPDEILLVDGDSLYSISSEFQLRRILQSKGGFVIINNPDSIALYCRKSIKSVIIITPKQKRD
jgi:hypothetical protein